MPRPSIDTFIFDIEMQSGKTTFAAKLETVLDGSERQIRGLCWHPQKMQLLSTSTTNITLWAVDEQENIWVPRHRLGETGGTDEAGYFDGQFSPDGSFILFHNYIGAFDLWQLSPDKERASPVNFPIGGHFSAVSDIAWEPSGCYLLSTSADKTTRIFSPLNDRFVEIARPQIHGHDLSCIASISSTLFVSGGEEKIFRAFRATQNFVTNLKTISGIELQVSNNDRNGEAVLDSSLITLPELGLSNKEVEFDDEDNEEKLGIHPEDLLFTEPPRQEQLTRLTLWPEIHKLYGHGYEVYAIAANHSSSLIATSCKASHFEHAAILLWCVEDWQVKATLKAHQLTVTGLAFSPNDQFLLSVSRDRTWNVFHCEQAPKSKAPDFDYKHCASMATAIQKKSDGHSRIIWACAWTNDSMFFGTVSRDKTLKVWKLIDVQQVEDNDDGAERTSTNVQLVSSFAAEHSLNALDFAHTPLAENVYLAAVGDEIGRVLLLSFTFTVQSQQQPSLTLLKMLNQSEAHSSTISRIRFRPQFDGAAKTTGNSNENSDNKSHFEFATSSNNHIVKFHRLAVCFELT